MKRAVLLAVLLSANGAWGKGDKGDKTDDEEESASDESDNDDEATTSDDEESPKKKKKQKTQDEDKPEPAEPQIQKQDLTGHDLGASKKATAFEKDRFFV